MVREKKSWLKSHSPTACQMDEGTKMEASHLELIFSFSKEKRKKKRLLFPPEHVVLKAMLMVCPVSGDKSWPSHVTFRGQQEMKFLATGTEPLELFNRHCFGVERSEAHSYLPSISLQVLGCI